MRSEENFCDNQVKSDGLMHSETVKISLMSCLETRRNGKVLNLKRLPRKSHDGFVRTCQVMSN